MRRKKLSAEQTFDHLCSDGTLLKCSHIRKSGQKNLYLRLQKDGSVQISTPRRVSRVEAEKFVQSKENWIVRKLAHTTLFGRENPSEYASGCHIWYMGRQYPVRYEQGARSCMDFDGRSLFYRAPHTENFSKSLDRFYLRTAKKVLADRIEYWSDRMQLYPKEVKFRRYRSRWGCCSVTNVITLNTGLLRYEISLVDYVIIHELAHIRHKHHKKEFWDLVGRFEPEWRSLRRELV